MNGHNLKSMLLYISYYSPDNITSEGCQNVLIRNYTKRTILVFKRDTLTSLEDEEWHSITSNLESGDKVEVIVVSGDEFIVDSTMIHLLYDEQIEGEMEHHLAADKDVAVLCYDEGTMYNISDSVGDDEPPDVNFNVSCHDDMPTEKFVLYSVDENVKDNKECHAVDRDVIVSSDGDVAEEKNSTVSCDDNMQADKNVIVSRADENRFRMLFKLPSLVRAILISRPIWFGLAVILIWITQRRSRTLVKRYAQKGKWLVDYMKKCLTYKKAYEARGVIINASDSRNGQRC